jgi:hypothetical protein
MSYLYFHRMNFILNELKCYVSATSSSRNHLGNVKEKE